MKMIETALTQNKQKNLEISKFSLISLTLNFTVSITQLGEKVEWMLIGVLLLTKIIEQRTDDQQ